VSVALGDLEHGTVGYQSIFAAGLTLLIMTLFLNILGHWTRKKFSERY
jgi:phosphate transport system permease protein